MNTGRAPLTAQAISETEGLREAGGPEHPRRAMRVVKHSVVIAGHRTSVSLEDLFWRVLKETAAQDRVSLAALIARVDAARGAANLSSALRVFVLERALVRGISSD